MDRDQFRAELGGRLRAAREENGFTLRDLAGLSGVSFGKLGDFERGTIEPSAWTLARIAIALRADANYLLGKESELS